jgi:HopA1 effector protein family
VFVRKGDRERVAFPGAFIFDAAPGMTPQIGPSVSVRAPSETYEAQPGYYFAFGESLDELADNLSLTRLYFHCRAEEAAPLVSELTAVLNRFQIPFQLKTPTAPSLYGRTDAAVLYIGGRYFPIAVRIVAYVREKVSLEAATPSSPRPCGRASARRSNPELAKASARIDAPHGARHCRCMAERRIGGASAR